MVGFWKSAVGRMDESLVSVLSAEDFLGISSLGQGQPMRPREVSGLTSKYATWGELVTLQEKKER